MIRRLIILLLIVGCGKQASEDNKNGIKWGNNLDSAFAIASNSNKLIMIDFMAEWCPPCKEMDKITFSNTNIIKKSNEFIPVRIDVDKQ
ncbi:MAG: thioredoxin family protein, partial [Candidatus Marinimicrobia bacterium]|nr:thioredoxin family protein [Candidatus Neomarinimicrobiota bacterium]